ncbi:CoF synthetase [Paenibacillus sp. JX-17]|uniref:CoF synthetase n=1 Tax=Paenibacillus lacisoli TaxID=3064525 RepID=A0ABT9CB36_9BACL|nr:CoF synthetase [Paenibacillus sp. JX-17]MDO7906469.1 CoF synthetase [Paenibacillus sp. JX-17]
MREEAVLLTERIQAYILNPMEEAPAVEEERFNRLTLELFAYQFRHQPVLRKYMQSRRRTPLTVRHWSEIPPMPIRGFKDLVLSCEPAGEAEAVFMTSGTTDPERKGRHYHPTLKVWDTSMKTAFRSYVLPNRPDMSMAVISPAEDMNRNSSLSRYLSMAVQAFGTGKSRLFFGNEGLDREGLKAFLGDMAERGEPVMILGATFAYVHLLDDLLERGLCYQLAEGSRILDTGGFKGQSREVEMEQLYADLQKTLGIGRSQCVNMYGMTELSSQFYDLTLSAGGGTAVKKGGRWIRTLVLDPETLQPVRTGQTGVLAHYDLANWNSCLAILTEDLGRKTDEGFELLGRMEGAEAKGCSIAVDQLLQAQKG